MFSLSTVCVWPHLWLSALTNEQQPKRVETTKLNLKNIKTQLSLFLYVNSGKRRTAIARDKLLLDPVRAYHVSACGLSYH